MNLNYSEPQCKIVEELTNNGWVPLDVSDIEKQPDGEFTITIRVRTLKPTKRKRRTKK